MIEKYKCKLFITSSWSMILELKNNCLIYKNKTINKDIHEI